MEQHGALRGEKARARGLEMESFPRCPLRGLRRPSPSGELPSLAHPQLAYNGTLDSAAPSFLLNRALQQKAKGEEAGEGAKEGQEGAPSLQKAHLHGSKRSGAARHHRVR